MTGKRPLEKSKKEDLRNNWTVASTHSLGVMEQIVLEAISKHIDCKKVIGNDLHGFSNRKSYMTSLIAFYNKMAGPLENRESSECH